MERSFHHVIFQLPAGACRGLLVIAVCLIAQSAAAQTTNLNADSEFWPALKSTFSLGPRSSIQAILEKHAGEDLSFSQWKVGVIASVRVRRIRNSFRADNDEDNHYNLVLAGGYEYLKTNQGDSQSREHRIVVQGTPRHNLGGFRFQDRSRIEFRWKNQAYNFRYRNKLTFDHPLKVDKFRFTPYGSAEPFWDRNRHLWIQTQFAVGLQVPYKKVLMVDTYYLRQHCPSCTPPQLNALGLTLNVYFVLKRK